MLKHGLEVRSAEYLPHARGEILIVTNKMLDFNSGKAGDALAKVQGELDEVKTVMLDNIERVLERGTDRLLVESTARLQARRRVSVPPDESLGECGGTTRGCSLAWCVCVFARASSGRSSAVGTCTCARRSTAETHGRG